MSIRDQIYWFRAVLRKRYEEEIRLIRIFNLAQAGGDAANNRLQMLNFELQKLEYDEAGIEPGQEWEYLHPEEEK